MQHETVLPVSSMCCLRLHSTLVCAWSVWTNCHDTVALFGSVAHRFITTLLLYFLHTQTQTHTRMHTHTHTRARAQTHARKHTCTHARKHTHTHMQTHTWKHTHTHTCKQTHTNTYTHVHAFTRTHTNVNSSWNFHIPTNISLKATNMYFVNLPTTCIRMCKQTYKNTPTIFISYI